MVNMLSLLCLQSFQVLHFSLSRRMRFHRNIHLQLLNTNKIASSIIAVLLAFPSVQFPSFSHVENSALSQEAVEPPKAFKMKDGLVYYDIREGDPALDSPRYGQFISFYFTAYYKPSPDAKLQFIDSRVAAEGGPYLQKHGNGRMIKGVEEGLHTMKVGTKRRIFVPPSLAFVDYALGPQPTSPWRRRLMNQALEKLDKNQGELVYDLELVMIRDDENDQGWYDDIVITPEEMRETMLQSLAVSNPELFDAANRKAAVDATIPTLK